MTKPTKIQPRRPPSLSEAADFVRPSDPTRGGKEPSRQDLSSLERTQEPNDARGSTGNPKRRLVKRKRTGGEVLPVTVYLPPDWDKPLRHAAVDRGTDLTGIIVHAVGLFLGK
jgi:hypothetical protein